MAKVKDIFGTGLSGRLGNMIFYQYKGKTCLRSISQREHKEATPLQAMQRKRFSEMMKFTRKFKFVLIPQIWNQAANTMSGFQFFMKTNSGAFNSEGVIADPRLVKLSTGKLQLPRDVTVERIENDPGYLLVKWVEGFYNGGIPFWDELLVISHADGLYSDIHYTGIRRGDQQGIFELPALDVPATHVYLFFASLDRAKYSESICIELN